MKALKALRKLLKEILKWAKIIIALVSAILFVMLLRVMGIKGLICFAGGMAVMTILCIHPRTNFIILTLIDMVNGDRSLVDFMKGGKTNEKETDWVEVKR